MTRPAVIPLATRAGKDAALAARRRVFAARMEPVADAYLSSDPPDARAFRAALQAETKGLFISAYMAGRGGKWDEVGPVEWGQMGPVLRKQYAHARRFSRDLEGKSRAYIIDRISKFEAASTQAFQRGTIRDRGLNPELLPAHPGDGTTECFSRCRCSWRVRPLSKRRGDFDVSWRLGATERHCTTCPERARQWVGLEIRGGRFVVQPQPINRTR